MRTPPWDCGRLVVEMLYHYASQGDVQMAVTCIIVLGDRIKVSVYECVLMHIHIVVAIPLCCPV